MAVFKGLTGAVILPVAVILLGCSKPGTGDPELAVLSQQSLPEPVLQDVAVAEREKLKSPSGRVIERRFSVEAAEGKVPLLKPSGGAFAELMQRGGVLETVPAPYMTMDASTETLTLEKAITAALANDLDTAQAAETVDRRGLESINAVFGYLPRVSATGEYAYKDHHIIDNDNPVFQNTSDGFGILNGRIEATQPLINLARMMAIRLADTNKSVARAAYVAAAQTAVFDAATAYFTAVKEQIQVSSVRARLGYLEEQAELERNSGASSSRELVNVEIGKTQIELLENEEELAVARNHLSMIIGQPVGMIESIPISASAFSDSRPENLEAYIREAMTRNPRLQQARLETLSKRQSFEQQFAEDFAPTVEAFARMDYEDREGSRYGGGSETWDGFVGVRVRVPIFNASGNGYRSLEAESDIRSSSLNESRISRTISTEIISLLDLMETQRGIIKMADMAQASAENLVKDAEAGVRRGTATRAEVLSRKAQLERVYEWVGRSRYDYLKSWARLAYMTGVPISL